MYVYLFIKILILVVGIWCDLLGDIQWREGALLWCTPNGYPQVPEEWPQNGNA